MQILLADDLIHEIINALFNEKYFIITST